MSPLIQAKAIKKSFYGPTRVDVLRGIDLEVAKGETLAILGRSGEGKSTLLNILGTLEPATSGELFLLGEKVSPTNIRDMRKYQIGFVFQAFYLLEDETVLDNILMPARISRKNTSAGSPSRKRAEELLERVGLSHRLNFPVKKLSGGEKQRTALARAFLNDPELILADEPSGNLDPESAEEVHRLLLAFAKDHGKTLIVVTHDENLASRCDRVLRLDHGQLIPV